MARWPERAAVVAVAALAAHSAWAQQALLAPLGDTPAWGMALLPQQQKARTQFSTIDLDGVPALRIEARASYGNLLHRLAPGTEAHTLTWRWRVDRFAAGADLRRKPTDDAAAKVCVMFDLALNQLPFIERQALRMARLASGEPLPAATLCYVWDALLPAQTVLPNAYSRRMRWMVLRGEGAPTGRWQREQRDLRADFLRAFGDEASEMPPLRAVLVGADADNTGGDSIAYITALELLR